MVVIRGVDCLKEEMLMKDAFLQLDRRNKFKKFIVHHDEYNIHFLKI